jgi:tungstate transport system permease protein
MDFLLDAFFLAVDRILSLDPEVLRTVWTSLRVSLTAVCLATLSGIPLGFLLATRSFPGHGACCVLFHTLMALPTVVVGLLVYGLFSRQGPLGCLGLLYTPWAMILAQWILSFPILVSLSLSAIQALDPRVQPTALTLGATPIQATWALLREARYGLGAAVAAGFARVITEVGAAMMVGGNIRGYTRTLTTAIALETAKGEFSLSLALGMILLALAFGINGLLHHLRSRGMG